jgi:dTDP-4-dehydrorhamnose 3,5-epimerase
MNDSEILIVGAKGQLGRALQSKYPSAHGADSNELDISDVEAVKRYDWSKIKIIINAAAYTNVDGAETSEGRALAWAVNATGVRNLAMAALENDAVFVHISTDYVFDGSIECHNEDEAYTPINVYGQSKAAGDIVASVLPKHYIIRSSWIVGDGKNFVRTMLELGQKDINPSVVSDQVGRLTFTNELVGAINHLLTNNAQPGTYNISNDGTPASWAEITRRIFELAGLDNTVTDVTTEEYYKGKEGIAPRPLGSELDLGKIKANGYNPADWQESLQKYVTKELA